ncbi:hypothetical protein LCGC14_1697290 [marine sediment metagenome]|uniref:Uncharacterized protein n=1 Tax=marine sediment metagenome TaxID=412755 RepID=A0A0F9KJ19_9ZZZZ
MISQMKPENIFKQRDYCLNLLKIFVSIKTSAIYPNSSEELLIFDTNS